LIVRNNLFLFSMPSIITQFSFSYRLVIFVLSLCFSWATSTAQQSDVVDFLRVQATITPDAITKSLRGEVSYEFHMLQDADSVFLDAHQMSVSNFDGIQKVKARADKIWFVDTFKKDETYAVSFSYEVKPKQTFYFMVNNEEMWTQGQGKYTSHWLPSLDDTNDKIEFDLSFVVPSNLTVIANGRLVTVIDEGETKKWQFDMENPMSSYLAAVAIGDYSKTELPSESDVPIELYYKPEDSSRVEPTYRYSKEIFDFLESEIGVAYPWEVYKQVPVRDFLYAGMENTSATFFSEAFLVDSIGFNDRNYINVNAHELAHQWFGNMVTAKSDEHHWLQEGFATYYALLVEKEIFGSDYFYWQLLQYAEQLHTMSDDGKGESLLNPKASSLTFYQKGAWALHVLRELVGDDAFRLAVKNYLNTYKFKVATSDDFLNEVKAVSNVDISEFEKNWLHQSAFRVEEAYQSLSQSTFIQTYFEISSLRSTSLKDKESLFKTALKAGDDFIGQEVVYQLAFEPISESVALYKSALESDNLYIRQAVVFSLERIPESLLPQYENLLNDDSYATQEMVMLQVWMQFPQRRTAILDHMKGRIGFQNKNIRQLWLALALLTDSYEESHKNLYFQELKGYTAHSYSFEIREKAFDYIDELELWDQESLRNLVNATTHPAWRFAKSSKTLLSKVIAKSDYAEVLKSLEGQLEEAEIRVIKSIQQ